MYVHVKPPYSRFFPSPPALYSIFFLLPVRPRLSILIIAFVLLAICWRRKNEYNEYRYTSNNTAIVPARLCSGEHVGMGTGARGEDLIIFMRSYLVCTARSVRVIRGKRGFSSFFSFYEHDDLHNRTAVISHTKQRKTQPCQ